jgi:hypothetical protein
MEMSQQMEEERSQYFERVSQIESVIREDIETKEAALRAFHKQEVPTAKMDESSELL